MATRVTVEEYRGPRRIVLDDNQRGLFLRELTRVKRGFPYEVGLPYRIAPGARIVVRRGTRRTEYLLFDRAVLYQTSTRRRWQFYFGLLLHEWLYR